ncbi:rhomboid family intramembrane serine protease [Bremerella cremea]|uniref:Rhomboid family intramembrane serine protease n=1 Tax=Blastopirellula marina TaxID=124 RepID=A0A2S8FV89_9BACT|nr:MULTISPECIES: rhomboid family intramembrane serine protease [Pirellulaceae]PQO36073.1 rhomboid family intramembrane serine protease [Blastopirellula marina]RCS48750.1 rhomboid family intramembrane serine protease [Bremerella cremea]
MLFPLVDENPTRRPPVVTIGLIAINTLLLLATVGFSSVAHNRLFIEYGFVPERLTSAITTHENVVVDLRDLLGNDPRSREVLEQSKVDTRMVLSGNLPAVAMTVFTSMFLHAGFMHLIGNMWFLWIFGNNVEDRLGHVPFLLFYLVGGVFAALTHWSATTGVGAMLPTVGASGAVAVVLGAYAVTYPKAQIRCLLFIFVIFLFVDLPAVAVLGIWMAGQIIEGFGALHLDIDGGVAWWAHIGGFVFGMAVMPLLTLLIPDTTYQSVLTQERSFQFDPRKHDNFRY